jgi:transcriptional regulator with XRE-family HTH domain
MGQTPRTTTARFEILILGRLLRAIRRGRGFQQCELAARANVSQPTLSRVENGSSDPTFSELYYLSIELAVTFEELIVLWELARDRALELEAETPEGLSLAALADLAAKLVLQERQTPLKRAVT